MKLKRWVFGAAVAAIAAFAISCGNGDDTPPPPPPTNAEAARNALLAAPAGTWNVMVQWPEPGGVTGDGYDALDAVMDEVYERIDHLLGAGALYVEDWDMYWLTEPETAPDSTAGLASATHTFVVWIEGEDGSEVEFNLTVTVEVMRAPADDAERGVFALQIRQAYPGWDEVVIVWRGTEADTLAAALTAIQTQVVAALDDAPATGVASWGTPATAITTNSTVAPAPRAISVRVTGDATNPAPPDEWRDEVITVRVGFALNVPCECDPASECMTVGGTCGCERYTVACESCACVTPESRLMGTAGTVARAGLDNILIDMADIVDLTAHFGAVGTADFGIAADDIAVAYGIPNNASGLRILPTGIAALQAGDILRATGRTSGSLTNARLELANLNADAGAGLGNEAVTPGSPWDIPAGVFAFERVLTDANITNGLRIAPNSWGAPGIPAANLVLSIDDLIVFRPEIVIGDQVINFNLATDAGFQELPEGPVQGHHAQIGSARLTIDGGSAIVTISEGAGERNFMYMGNRAANSNGINVTGTTPGNVIRVTGRTGAEWNQGGGRMEIAGTSAEFAENLAAGATFTMHGAITGAVRIEANSWGTWGTEAERSAVMSFYIYSIIVGTDLFQPAANPADTVDVTETEDFWPTPVVTDPGTAVFSLAAWLAENTGGPAWDTPYLRQNDGAPTTYAVVDGGINVTNRANAHSGLDIRIDDEDWGLDLDLENFAYTIIVAGNVIGMPAQDGAATQVAVTRAGGDWIGGAAAGNLTPDRGENASFSITFPIPADFGEHAQGHGLRIQVNNDALPALASASQTFEL